MQKYNRFSRPILRLLVFTSLLITFSVTGLLAGDKTGFGRKDRVENAFVGQIYNIPSTVKKLRQVQWSNPVGTIYARELDIPKTDFRDGFPGITDRYEWFAIRYKAKFRVLDEGKYRFKL